eukprot:snap_masked-scaffold_42-processed-gene-0.12-mRNA-1 protein AED:1.00 eAED:1.00 QI:0/-1/0/0/-1/1/1/0/241
MDQNMFSNQNTSNYLYPSFVTPNYYPVPNQNQANPFFLSLEPQLNYKYQELWYPQKNDKNLPPQLSSSCSESSLGVCKESNTVGYEERLPVEVEEVRQAARILVRMKDREEESCLRTLCAVSETNLKHLKRGEYLRSKDFQRRTLELLKQIPNYKSIELKKKSAVFEALLTLLCKDLTLIRTNAKNPRKKVYDKKLKKTYKSKTEAIQKGLLDEIIVLTGAVAFRQVNDQAIFERLDEISK